MIDIIVEHPNFGIGEITEINFDPNPIISVLWNDDRRGYYFANELEFLVISNVHN